VEEWDGLDGVNESADKAKGSGSDSDSDSEFEEDIQHPVDSLLTTLGPRLDERSKGQLSKRATLFFDQPEFDGLDGEEENAVAVEEEDPVKTNGHVLEAENEDVLMEEEESASEDDFQVVPTQAPEPDTWDDDDSDGENPTPRPSDSRP
jgi:AdoMet-dependent rRNA methyltransferase SPB1